MRVVLGTFVRNRIRGRGIGQRIDQALTEATPWMPIDGCERQNWQAGRVRIDVVTNEPASQRDRPLLAQTGDVGIAWAGHLRGSAAPPINDTDAARLGGIFALLQGRPDTLQGWTTVHRMEPLYLAEGSHVVALSNSARVAATAAGVPRLAPSVESLLALSSAGFMISDHTPYARVHAVPADSSVAVTRSGVIVRPLPPPDVDPDAPVEIFADMLASALVDAADDIRGCDAEVVCHITGGKDSRLAVAAFHAAGVEFTTSTTGFDEHPDSVIGTRVARLLGVDHRQVRPTLQAGAVKLNPLERAYHTLRASEGMLTCWETQSARGDRYDASALECGGHGGELLRAGFAHGMVAPTIAEASNKVRKIAARSRHLLAADARDRLDALVAPWIKAVEDHPIRGLERVYRSFRSGRWHAVARAAYTMRRPRIMLLADNQVVRTAMRAPQVSAADEQLVYLALRALNPQLADVPLFKDRWGFETSAPLAGISAPAWESRAPMPPATGPGGFNARIHYTQQVQEHFADVILSSPFVDELFDRAALEHMVAIAGDKRRPRHVSLLWSLYTAAHLCARTGETPAPPSSEAFLVPVPDKR